MIRGLSLATMLVLARLLNPADFGVFAVISFMTSLFVMIGDMGLGAALIQSESEPTDGQLAAVWTAQLTMATVFIALIWLASPLVSLLGQGLPPDTGWMLRLLSLTLFPVALRALPSVMLERQLRFGPLARSEITAQVGYGSTAIILAALGIGAWSFVAAALVQFTLGAVILNLAWGRFSVLRLSLRGIGELIAFGIEYQTAMILAWLRDGPIPFIGAVVIGPFAAGLLDLAWSIGQTAATIDATLGRVAFPMFSRLQDRRADQSRALEMAISLTTLVSVPVQFWVAAVAPILIPLVFGAKWTLAVAPVQGVCIGMMFRFPTRYLWQIAFANGSSRTGLYLAGTSSALALLPFAPALMLLGLPGAGAAFIVGSFAAFAVTAVVCARFVSVSWLRFARFIAIGAIAALPTHIVATTISGICGLLVGSAIYAVIFGSYVLSQDRALVGMALRYARDAVWRSVPDPA
jgi:PST family polysaccharide transporter